MTQPDDFPAAELLEMADQHDEAAIEAARYCRAQYGGTSRFADSRRDKAAVLRRAVACYEALRERVS